MSISMHANKATLDAAKRKLADARAGLKNNGVAMQQVAVFLDQWVQRNFQSKGGKVGGWEPFKYGGRLGLKDASKSKQRRRVTQANAKINGRWVNTTAQLLMDSSALRLSFLPFVRGGVAGIGSDLPYSKPHHEGLNGLPERRLLPTNADVKVEVKEILDNFVLLKIRGANA